MDYDYDFRDRVGSLPPFVMSVLRSVAKTRRAEVVKALEAGFDYEEAWGKFQTGEKVREACLKHFDRDFDWNKVIVTKTLEEALEAILRPMQHTAVFEEESVDFTVHDKGEIWVRFEVWGESADPDNPDEIANYDREVGPKVKQLLGVSNFESRHTLESGAYTELSFVYNCRATFKLPTRDFLDKVFAKELSTLIGDGRLKAVAEGLIKP